MARIAEEEKAAAPVPLGALFGGFLKVSLLAFGGGLVWARRLVVDERRWLDEADFADVLSLCQFMPGPNIVGITVCVGARLRGAAGALAALAGFTLIPWVLGFGVGVLYLQNTHIPLLQHILGGVSATAAGLLTGTGLRLLLAYRNRPLGLLFAGLAFVALAFTRLPLVAVLLCLAPLSIAAAALAGAGTRR